MNVQIFEEASAWFVDFRSGDVDLAARKRFDAWLRKSPEHLRAYLEITEIWQDAGEFPSKGASDADDLIARAQSVDNVVRLEPAAPISNIERQPRFSVRLMAGLAAAVVLVVVGAWASWSQRNTYSTSTGEQRSVLLADGSLVQLNALSRIRIHYSSRQRDIQLLKGQALFRVAKNKERPFVVHSGSTLVRAVGTQFDVYRRRAGTVVTVLEGNVLVTAPAQTGSGTTEMQRSPLAAGEQLIVKPQTASIPARVDTSSVTAWTQRQLIFNRTTLADVVEEFNRYNSRPLVIEGQALASLEISGVYASPDPTLLLRFLSAQPGIRVRESDAQVVIETSP